LLKRGFEQREISSYNQKTRFYLNIEYIRLNPGSFVKYVFQTAKHTNRDMYVD